MGFVGHLVFPSCLPLSSVALSVEGRSFGPFLFVGIRYYFGVGGGAVEFTLFLEAWPGCPFSVERVAVIDDGVSSVREILCVSRTAGNENEIE